MKEKIHLQKNTMYRKYVNCGYCCLWAMMLAMHCSQAELWHCGGSQAWEICTYRGYHCLWTILLAMHCGQAELVRVIMNGKYGNWDYNCPWVILLAIYCRQAEHCGSSDAREICILGLLLHLGKSACNAFWASVQSIVGVIMHGKYAN